MKRWVLVVQEDYELDPAPYVYYFDTWKEVIAKLANFDGLAIEYSISRRYQVSQALTL